MCSMLGCHPTECDLDQENECRLYNHGLTRDETEPTDNLYAGWGDSKTCKDDGNIVLYIIFNGGRCYNMGPG